MVRYYPQPTIIGSGLTGLLISNALSNARIAHVLIGGPPPTDSPRLGESLNTEATLHFLTEFPEFSDCYYPKRFATTYAGDFSGTFDFSFLRSLRSRLLFVVANKPVLDALIHIDRVRLDAALYEKVIDNPYCTQIDARVKGIETEPNSDNIRQLILDDGAVLPVSHLFDATGHIRLLARLLNIPRRMLGRTQHVVYTHYHADDVMAATDFDAPWRHGTNIVRLYEALDGIDGLAWCLPLGATVSIGMTTPLSPAQLPAEEYLEITGSAFARYGIAYRDHYTLPSRIARARMEFYTHSRAFGANWLLTGAAHTQVWWPTSAGLDTSVAAAHCAPLFVNRPARIAARYQTYMNSLTPSQTIWNWATSHPYGSFSGADLRALGDRLFWSIGARLLKSFQLEDQGALRGGLQTVNAQIVGQEIWARMPAPVLYAHARPDSTI